MKHTWEQALNFGNTMSALWGAKYRVAAATGIFTLLITQENYENGLRTARVLDKNGVWDVYYDYTIPINKMLENHLNEIKNFYLPSTKIIVPAKNVMGEFGIFYSLVNTRAPWDLKLKKQFEKDLGVSYPASIDGAHRTKYKMHAPMVYNGEIITPEILGNRHYGFMGTAFGFDQEILLWGGGVAAAKGSLMEKVNAANAAKANGDPYYGDDPEDSREIINGISWYYGYMQK